MVNFIYFPFSFSRVFVLSGFPAGCCQPHPQSPTLEMASTEPSLGKREYMSHRLPWKKVWWKVVMKTLAIWTQYPVCEIVLPWIQGVLVWRRKAERVGCIGTGNPYNLMEANTTSHQIHIWSDLQGVTALYTERCFHSRYTASNQSWTLEWPGNEVNEVM